MQALIVMRQIVSGRKNDIDIKGKCYDEYWWFLHKAAAGDMVFLSSGVTHNLTNTGNEQCEYFAFQWRN